MEDALATLLGERVQVYGASRTDAGVHAEGQVASFSTRLPLAPGDVRCGLCLEGVRILDVAAAMPSFHARASAAGKRYGYRFGQESERAWDLGRAALDWEKARAALQGLRGLPDLAGLSSPSRSPTPAPPLDEWSLRTIDAGAELVVRAPAFRRHQVRNLAGHLAAVALGIATPESLASLAAARRPWRGATAPPHGLTLLEVLYPPALDPFRAAEAETAAGRARLPR